MECPKFGEIDVTPEKFLGVSIIQYSQQEKYCEASQFMHNYHHTESQKSHRDYRRKDFRLAPENFSSQPTHE